MASGEQVSDGNKVCDLNNQNNSATNGEQQPTIDENQPVREITQTDHLNKRLLSAFLDKINDSGGQGLEVAGDSEASDDWKDQTSQ